MRVLVFFIGLISNLYASIVELTNEEKEFLKNRKIVVATTTNWQPFSFKEANNEALGISYEYWQLLTKKLNISNDVVFFNKFQKGLESIKDRSSDIILSAGETVLRKEYAIFSKKYLSFPISIVTKKDENFIENMNDILDKKIAVGSGFTAYELLKERYPNISFITVNSVKDGLNLVSNGKVYAFVDIKPVLNYNILKYDHKDLKISGNSGVNFELKFMIRKDYEILANILNKAIDSTSDMEVLKIVSKWDNVQFQTRLNYQIIWILSSIIILILAAFVYRSYVLSSLNKRLQVLVEAKTKKLNKINKNLEEIVKRKTEDLIKKDSILNHQSKLAAMGEMIENIAHQWRQPLSIISMVSTSLKLKKQMNILTDDEFIEAMDSINNSSQYLSNTIDDFRNFFQDKEADTFFISSVIRKSTQLLRTNLDNFKINVIEQIEDIEIKSYKNELLQVLLNMVSNAIDILQDTPEDGRNIVITTYNDTKYLYICVKDSGNGINKNIINRVFEPYFTTKHKSKGTGIGLYMALEIVTKQLKGEISVSNVDFEIDDKKYFGAKFKIKLPINIKE